MQTINENGLKPIHIWTNNIEDSAVAQLKNLASLPFIHARGLAVMPDVHAGRGSTVGAVVPTIKAIIPACVGVDIGCGMVAVKTSLTALDLPESLKDLRHQIERDIPLGPGGYHSRERDMQLDLIPAMTDRQKDILERAIGINRFQKKITEQIGTLGSGNHFVEVCLDEEQFVWVMLHSGSRGAGNIFADKYISLAQKEMEKYFIKLPDKDLAYLPDGTELFSEYISGMLWLQDFALANRTAMLKRVLDALTRMVKPYEILQEAINCHHNYTTKENHDGINMWITRKGALSAREGQMGIIPSAMGQPSYIVKGKGNSASYCSCSHGSGRKMSRTQAKKEFTVDQLIAQTEGVECPKDASVLDEIPGAYKDINAVLADQSDLIEVVAKIKAVLCVKGT